jgi:integrase
MTKKARSKLNRHLFLRGGIWWTRIVRGGRWLRQSTGCPASEVASARKIRDGRLAKIAESRAGLERPVEPLFLGGLIDLYMREECQSYDREKGGEQPGTKRSADSDESSKKRVLRHLSRSLSAAAIDRERLLDCARGIEREDPAPAAGTRRKTFAFLRRVYSWAVENKRKTGVPRTPFAELTRNDRAKLFPRVAKRGRLYTADELRAIYDALPAHLVPFVRFAVHTGMRLREITTLTWGNVDLERRFARIEARFAKNGQERKVALGEVAFSVLDPLRTAATVATDHVFLGRRGKQILDVRSGFDAAVLKAWQASEPGERKPRFHDLRKTGATRVEAVSSKAVAKAFLGHADVDVTDTYILADLDAVRDAVNRAAFGIDGTVLAGVVRFETKMARQIAQRTQASGK